MRLSIYCAPSRPAPIRITYAKRKTISISLIFMHATPSLLRPIHRATSPTWSGLPLGRVSTRVCIPRVLETRSGRDSLTGNITSITVVAYQGSGRFREKLAEIHDISTSRGCCPLQLDLQ